MIVVPDLLRALRREVALAELLEPVIRASLADYECEHGRLPGDPTPPCGCWSAESVSA